MQIFFLVTVTTTAHLHVSSPLLWKLLSSRLFVSYLELQIWSPLSAFSFHLKTQSQFNLFGQDFVFIKGLWLQNWWWFSDSLVYLNRRDKLVSKWRQWRRVFYESPVARVNNRLLGGVMMDALFVRRSMASLVKRPPVFHDEWFTTTTTTWFVVLDLRHVLL